MYARCTDGSSDIDAVNQIRARSARIVLVHNSGFCLDVTDSHGHGLPTSLWGMLHRALDLQPDPGMPGGKPAGVRCVQLDEANRCRIFGRPERPAVCGSLRPEPDMCGASAVHAMQFLTRLEAATASS